MSLVKGEKYEVEIFDGGVWKRFVCARDANMNIETELIETTVTGSGNFRTYEPSVHSATAGFSGITALNVPGFVTLPELQSWQLAKTKLLFRLTNTSINNDVYVRQFRAFITNSTDTGGFDGIATFQLSTRVTGTISQIFTPPSPTSGKVYRYPAMGETDPPATGSTSWTISGLGGKDILSFVKDGRGQSDIILSGTPVDNQVLYETVGADGVFTSAVPYEDATPPYLLYQNL